MAGRARTPRLHRFSFSEIDKALLSGTIPIIYLSNYIRDEIKAEGLSRKVE